MIRLFKWSLLVLSVCWAIYSIWGLWRLSQAFPGDHSSPTGISNVIAGLQLFAVTLGPAVVAGATLLVRWPAKGAKRISN